MTEWAVQMDYMDTKMESVYLHILKKRKNTTSTLVILYNKKQ